MARHVLSADTSVAPKLQEGKIVPVQITVRLLEKAIGRNIHDFYQSNLCLVGENDSARKWKGHDLGGGFKHFFF